MAQSVHLFLKANGKDIKGESTQVSMGRADSIECVAFNSGVTSAREAASNLATGRRQHEPIIIRKRIDKASPLLAKALCQNEAIEGVFKFFRPNPTGDGTTEQFFTVAFKGGRVVWQDVFLPDLMAPTAGSRQVSGAPYEELGLKLAGVSWTYTNGGITWSGS